MRIHNVLAITGLSFLLLSPLSYAAESAKTFYTNRCQGCHGPDGKGSPTMAKALQVAIPDLTTKEMGKKPGAEILEALSKGKGKMPAATGLSDKELKDLVAHVKSLSKGK
ncbi:MAG: cytochrome c [Deltaproteobacteria bacterium]|nr:cytochrome c [Deltaproteobacteria bacterium]